jgi:hypothetical protein
LRKNRAKTVRGNHFILINDQFIRQKYLFCVIFFPFSPVSAHERLRNVRPKLFRGFSTGGEAPLESRRTINVASNKERAKENKIENV